MASKIRGKGTKSKNMMRTKKVFVIRTVGKADRHFLHDNELFDIGHQILRYGEYLKTYKK
jgi:hypothetical protein